jgi:guanylate kinase
MLFDRNPDTFTLSVSHTTRGPRPCEQEGVDYHYVTKEEFLALKGQGGFVERYDTYPVNATIVWSDSC